MPLQIALLIRLHSSECVFLDISPQSIYKLTFILVCHGSDRFSETYFGSKNLVKLSLRRFSSVEDIVEVLQICKYCREIKTICENTFTYEH